MIFTISIKNQFLKVLIDIGKHVVDIAVKYHINK